MERRRDPKTLPQTQTYQERRRSEALEKQKHARDRALSRSRQLLAGAAGAESPPPPPPAAAAAGGPPAPRGGGRRASGRAPRHEDAARQRWAGQLMLPEWLVEAPADLAAAWYVLPRPEGQRCLVVAARGQTVARLPGGAELERFASALPAGAPGGGGGEGCVLDCVRHEGDGTYYVLDTLSWRGHDVYDCTAEFRLFWGHSKLAELDQEGQQQQQQQQQCFLEPPGSAQGAGGEPAAPPAPPPWRRVAALPAYAATPGGLRAAHAAPAPFTRDGLCLLHRAAQYAPGLTPLALRWKDAASSAYVVETDPQGAVPPQQRVVLRYRMDRSVATGDEPPVPLATMPAAFAEAAGPDLRAGRLLRFRLGGGGVQLDATGRPVGADLHYDGIANPRRSQADLLSKILFQHLARTRPITLEALLAAAAAGGGGNGGGGGGGGDGSSIAAAADGGGVAEMAEDAQGGDATCR